MQLNRRKQKAFCAFAIVCTLNSKLVGAGLLPDRSLSCHCRMMWAAGTVAAMSSITFPAVSALVSRNAESDQQGEVTVFLLQRRRTCHKHEQLWACLHINRARGYSHVVPAQQSYLFTLANRKILFSFLLWSLIIFLKSGLSRSEY